MTVKLYEFAKKHGKSAKELLVLLRKNGFDIHNHMSSLPEEAVEFLESNLSKKTPKPGSSKKSFARSAAGASAASIKQEKKQPPEVPLKKMSLGELADHMQIPATTLILTLLRQGTVATKNQILSVDMVQKIAEMHQVATKAIEQLQQESFSEIKSIDEAGEVTVRPPIVVVMGHVDHGKTTLLDYIRKTRVAAREKGGITQHLGAYAATTTHGEVVFLDTPGHEAFSLIRARGVKVADIAILVVAADDGVMPQTIEALAKAKNAGIPIIVALNKVDKANERQIEAAYRGLAQADLLPEQWGGQTPCISISALTGVGVDELLEMIWLQAQLLELKANISASARGFVLESRLEKGRGSVATVVLHNGSMNVGDYFMAGNTTGKITSIINSHGKRLQSAGPAEPVQVSGFEDMPQAGDPFKTGSLKEVRALMHEQQQARSTASGIQQSTSSEALNIIIKTDSVSSKEALLGALEKISQKTYRPIHVIYSGVGNITESDVSLAQDTDALLYGLHIKVESSSVHLATKLGVNIFTYDIIYKLLEDIEQHAESARPIKMVSKKVGEATVLKVFDIKNVGVIAGARVITGSFVRDGQVTIWRGNKKIGKGPIVSLQRERNDAKEVRKGFECAFRIEGFVDWLPDDRVECYQEVPEE